MPQFKVPQNLDMEDRIIGHLTLIQFGYLVFGGMLAYFFLIKVPGIFGVLLALPIAIFAFALAVVKVQDQPLPKFVKSLFLYVRSPRDRSWHHDGGNQPVIVKDTPKKQAVGPATKRLVSADEMRTAARRVDSRGYSEVDQE